MVLSPSIIIGKFLWLTNDFVHLAKVPVNVMPHYPHMGRR